MRQPHRLLTIGLALCAVAALVGALVLLHRSHTVGVDAEAGEWLLTVAVALVLTGAFSMVVNRSISAAASGKPGTTSSTTSSPQTKSSYWPRVRAAGAPVRQDVPGAAC
jgi:hypothetical protein